jgi:hypothetical protein
VTVRVCASIAAALPTMAAPGAGQLPLLAANNGVDMIVNAMRQASIAPRNMCTQHVYAPPAEELRCRTGLGHPRLLCGPLIRAACGWRTGRRAPIKTVSARTPKWLQPYPDVIPPCQVV